MRAMAALPTLRPTLADYWEAFQRLGSCRALGPVGEGPIPWTAMDQMAYRLQIEDEEYDYFIDLMSGLDETYLAETAKKGKPGKKH